MLRATQAYRVSSRAHLAGQVLEEERVFSTINGNAKRGNGILNNELYVGRLAWNRQTFLKDPSTGRRVSRLNPRSKWIVKDVPELCIIEQKLWDQTKTRQDAIRRRPGTEQPTHFRERRRPKYLFCGLTKCARCGGGYAMISKDLLGCAAARNKGTCDNRVNIRRDRLETACWTCSAPHGSRALPDLLRGVHAQAQSAAARERGITGCSRVELARIDCDLDKLVQGLLDGVPGVKEKMVELEARETQARRFSRGRAIRSRCRTRTWPRSIARRWPTSTKR